MNVAFGTAVDGRFVARVDEHVAEVPGWASLDDLLRATPQDWADAIDAAAAAPAIEPPALGLPFTVGDYVDFYSSLEHATFFGRILRPEGDPLTPNWRRMPVGYHGRSSTIVASGTPVRRPQGQVAAGDFGPTRALDVEVELGFVIGGRANPLGEPIPIDAAPERIFGLVLLNDWSARDIQRFEGQPLGPFLSKAFATSISSWVVPVSQLADARVPTPPQDPPPLPHLAGAEDWNFDLEISAELNGEPITRTNARRLYWSVAQQLAHLGSGGAIVRAGDLLGTGTISGGDSSSGGSLMEMGRPFLDDGDEIVLRCAPLGELSGRVLPAA